MSARVIVSRRSLPSAGRTARRRLARSSAALFAFLWGSAPEVGAQLLRTYGVSSTDPADLVSASKALRGHALALRVLGSYLAEACGGDARRWREANLGHASIPEGAEATRVIASYERWLGEGPLLQLLRLQGLFDRPASPTAIGAIRRPPSILGVTDQLPQGERAWRSLEARLRRIGLLAPADPASPGSLDAHPLVREHFANRLREKFPTGWRAAHERLFLFLKSSTVELPDTISGLDPLYAALWHGREAGLAEDAFTDVYGRRIQRGDKYYSVRVLGATSLDLAALSRYFDVPWVTPLGELTPNTKALLLNRVGFGLRAAGRLDEAVQATRAALELRVAMEQWKDAAVNASNLSEILSLLGDLTHALDEAQQAVGFADRSEVPFWQTASRTALACVLHYRGEFDKAKDMFVDAEDRERRRGVKVPFLYSLRGFQFCDLLLDQREAAAVRVRAAETLVWAQRASGGG